MFKILIVEDQPDKLKHILKTIEVIEGVDNDLMDTVIDANDAKKLLLLHQYDLLILDISIPLRKSEEIVPDGGLILLREITERIKYKTPTHIFGLTSHDDIYQKAKGQFGENVLTVIKYDLTSVTWQTTLSNGIVQRISAKEDSKITETYYDYDLAIVCALKLELDANRQNGWNWKMIHIENDDTVYYEAKIEGKNGKSLKAVAANASRMGMPFCSSLAMKMITMFKPRYLFITGIMAGVKGKVNLGDVVIANPIWDWGSGKWVPNLKNEQELKKDFKEYEEVEVGNDEFRKSIFQIDPYQYSRNTLFTKAITMLSEDHVFLFQLRSGFKGAPKHDIALIEGPVASGASVLADKNIISNIKKEQHRKLVGVEMEAYGLFCASENAPNPKPIPLCIKSVVDFGDFEKSDDFQEFGCYASAIIARKIFEQINGIADNHR